MSSTIFVDYSTAVPAAWLNDVNTVTYVSVINAKLAPYGAVGKGTTDDTVALQAALTAAAGKVLFLPAGTYLVSSTLTISSGTTIIGAGRLRTRITWTSTTLDVFSINTTDPVQMSDFQMTGPASATAGAMIKVDGPSASGNAYSTFSRLLLSRGYDQIKMISSLAWTIEACVFSGFVHRALTVANALVPDAGDGLVHGNCIFANGIAGSVAIYQTSSGGLKVLGNKFNGLGTYAYQMQLASAVVTSDLVFVGNSVENFTSAAMFFDSDGGGAICSNIVICGNQFALNPRGIDMSSATAFLRNISITGNTINVTAAGTYGIIGVELARYSISGNIIGGVGSGTPVGISLDGTCSAGIIGENSYANLTTNISDASVSRVPLQLTSPLTSTASLTAHNATAVPAGGTAGAGILMSSTANLGVFFGSGVPTLSAAKGSLYLRTDGSGTTDRFYINTNGTTTWTAGTTVA